MGVMTELQIEEFEKNHTEYNLDKNGDYIRCTRGCQCRLAPNEKWDDLCLDCKIHNDD